MNDILLGDFPSYCKKPVVQDSMEVFTLCDCDNITNPYASQKENPSHKSESVSGPLLVETIISSIQLMVHI